MPIGLNTVYPHEPAHDGRLCAIDLDAIRRIALRAPMLGDPLSMQASTFASRLDGVLEHSPLNRVLVVAHALAEVVRADTGAAEIFKASGLARQIRAEVDSRKAGALREASPAIVQAGRLAAPQGGRVDG